MQVAQTDIKHTTLRKEDKLMSTAKIVKSTRTYVGTNDEQVHQEN